jgi:hypothetical protein
VQSVTVPTQLNVGILKQSDLENVFPLLVYANGDTVTLPVITYGARPDDPFDDIALVAGVPITGAVPSPALLLGNSNNETTNDDVKNVLQRPSWSAAATVPQSA